VNATATRHVLVASLPFYINAVAIALCAKLDATMLWFVTRNEAEIGWYGAASNVASIALLLAPLAGSVLMPLLARTEKRSREELWVLVRRTLAGILSVLMPCTLFIALGAELWTRWVFGSAFAPSAMSLRALAPNFVLTYVAMTLSFVLVAIGRAWTLTLISIVGTLINPALALVLVPFFSDYLGPGGAGVGSGLAVTGMELTVTTLFLANIGRVAFDRRLTIDVLKTCVCCASVIVLDRALAPLGDVRLAIDAGAYAVLALMTRAVRPAELIALVRTPRE
jgi:O-antigen/teichoic acid export membrane protein